jgi:hypothetical protein
MKRRLSIMLPLLGLFAFVLACNLTATASNPPAQPQPQAVAPGETLPAAPVAAGTSGKVAASATPGPTSTVTETATTAFTGPKPGEPPARISGMDDSTEQTTPVPNSVNAGDNFSENIFERPFSLDMTYRPELDIVKTNFAKDANWFYTTIFLAGPIPESANTGPNYGVELDINKDGRGEFLVWASPAYSKDWTRANTKIYGTSTNMVGGPHPTLSDAPWSGTTYDKMLFVGATDSTNNGAWVRISPNNSKSIDIAFNPSLVGGPSEFVWGVWADDGIKDPTKFDYNDQFTKVQAGAAFKGDANFPPKAIFAVDNTCRFWVGFTPTVAIPGSCFQVPPTATPTLLPTKTKTKTLIPPPA